MAGSTVDGSQINSSERQLPQGFESIEDILNMPTPRLKTGPLVNVIGFIKDHQPPIRSRGTDFKCSVEIKDKSVEYSQCGIKIHIFAPEDKMPLFSGAAGDALLVRKAKTQMWAGIVSLVSNRATEFHIIPASRIPQSMSGVRANLWRSYAQKGRYPTALETEYVIWANTFKENMSLPSAEVFEERAIRAMSVKQKFSLLKDVKSEAFHDILGEVVKVFDGSGESLTVYLSDYTANSSFYNYAWSGVDGEISREGDEYGYVSKLKKAPKEWPGPYGKLTIQLTLWDGHAAFVREKVKIGQWVLLKNVQFKIGALGCLEGYLRGDRHTFEGKIQVEIMQRRESEDQDEDYSENYARWKEGIRRKYEWEEKFKRQIKQLRDDAAGGFAEKRKLDGTEKNGSKRRRKEKREAAFAKAAAAANKAKEIDLNENVKCNHPDISVSTIKEILEPEILPSTSEAEEVRVSPFTVAKYRANVNVVDYFPDKIEDFAVGRRLSDYDMLSDYSGGEDSDVEEDMRNFRDGKGFRERVWEWRFALQVEEARKKDEVGNAKEKERMWLMVDNQAAQMLLGLEEDAANLRKTPGLLSKLKEQLFKLWGNLEEHKSSLLSQQRSSSPSDLPKSSTQQRIPQSSLDSIDSSPPRPKPGAQPDLYSSDIEDDNNNNRPNRKPSALAERDVNVTSKTNSTTTADSKPPPAPTSQPTIVNTDTEQTATSSSEVRNRPFTCCIQQYGIKVDESDPRKADAGPGKRWERRFGIFGTMIL
ncbi:hypothetical protein F5884DRAFT_800255 [Xylogone sp. PMI_703]|nr:hypothetical protein F5884DRAFT_800255 [Xylogone sp. PMI_703]